MAFGVGLGYFVQGTEELINCFQVGTTNILGSVCRHIGFYGYGEIVPVLIKAAKSSSTPGVSESLKTET